MQVTYNVMLKKSELKSKFIDAIKYLTGTASGMFHSYQLYFNLRNYSSRTKVEPLEKQFSFLVVLDQYSDQMQLCTVQGLLKKSPDIFNNTYYKYINILFIFGKIFDELEVNIGDNETTYSYDNNIRPPLNSIANDFTEAVEKLFFKQEFFNDKNEFFFDYRKLMLDFLRKCSKDYLSDDEFNDISDSTLITLKADRFLKKVISVIHEEASRERTQYIYFLLSHWAAQQKNILIASNVLFNLVSYEKSLSIEKSELSFIDGFTFYLSHILYKPDESIFTLAKPSELEGCTPEVIAENQQILNLTAEQIFTYENIVYSLQIGKIAGLIDVDLSLVPPTVNKKIDIRKTGLNTYIKEWAPFYNKFAKLFSEETADSQKEALEIIARLLDFAFDVHYDRYIKYSMNALKLTADKPVLSKYLKPSLKMQKNNIIPV